MLLSRTTRHAVAFSLVAAAAVYTGLATRVERAAIAAQGPATAPRPVPAVRIDRNELMRVVQALASPAFEGRRTGTRGGREAREYIDGKFRQIGLTPATRHYNEPFRFVHTSVKGFLLPGRTWKTTYEDAANVVAVEPGARPDARTLVVSAHYDHLGKQGGRIYPGADDNASGIAAMLAVARYVHAHPLAHRVVFAAFDAEELGLEGAKAFMRSPPVPVRSLALDINFDMVARNDRDEIFAAGTYHTPSLKAIVEDVQRRSRVRILYGHDRPMTRAGMVEDWTMESDHGVFHQAGIPFLYFGVEDHPDYHQPTDTADKIDPKFFGNVAETLLDVVMTADASLP